ncbi:cytochrome P450 [Actinomadura sp. DC4]|uniref:cytochrome P450 n=1 Tax=Actinomadura sp. DC4 TaxID=3055069 RepID=UPI0025AFC85B|nr:cytochrome P450 [Actinomadura sp. DC4]MDN3358593.1 cytochrome P450 [Actinomadura sp. DC4]
MDDLPLFPFPPGPVMEPPPEYAERRSGCPFGKVAMRTGGEAILLVRHRDIAAATASPLMSRNHARPQVPRGNSPDFLYAPDLLINQGTDTHAKVHRTVTRALGPSRVASTSEFVGSIAGALLDSAPDTAGPADLVAAYTSPLPLLVVCRLLRIPDRDAARIHAWAAAYAQVISLTSEERDREVEDFTGYVAALVTRVRDDPGDSVLDELASPAAGLTDAELVSVVKLLVSAGVEAVSTALARMVLQLLLDRRAGWTQLRERPESVPAAVDELLRLAYEGNVAALRVATGKVELPSGTVAAGQAVLLAWIAGLHDPEVYPDPTRLRFDRPSVRMIGFGGGRHICPGAGLAKEILRVALTTLLDRRPDLRLAVPPEAIRFEAHKIGNVIQELPVRW